MILTQSYFDSIKILYNKILKKIFEDSFHNLGPLVQSNIRLKKNCRKLRDHNVRPWTKADSCQTSWVAKMAADK
jgi:hypothetical protein